MNERYQIVSTDAIESMESRGRRAESRKGRFAATCLALCSKLSALCSPLPLPMLELIEQAQWAIDDLIDVMGRATIEAVLQMSAEGLAGPKQQGKRTDRDVAYHGTQAGRVALKERRLRVNKPRLRKKSPVKGECGEVHVPAYAAMRQDARLADRMLEIMMADVSTRRYEQVLPEMAEQCGISKSQ